MNELLAGCGINCEECPAYLAKQNEDDALRLATLEKWSSPEYPLTKEDINCDGCKIDGEHFKFCSECAIRDCVSDKGVETCAHCDQYMCDVLKNWLSQAGDGPRETLERIRAAL